MSGFRLTCPRCGNSPMKLKLREGYLECDYCFKKELVDGDFGYAEYRVMLKQEEEDYRNMSKRGLRAELSGVVDDAPMYE